MKKFIFCLLVCFIIPIGFIFSMNPSINKDKKDIFKFKVDASLTEVTEIMNTRERRAAFKRRSSSLIKEYPELNSSGKEKIEN